MYVCKLSIRNGFATYTYVSEWVIYENQTIKLTYIHK